MLKRLCSKSFERYALVSLVIGLLSSGLAQARPLDPISKDEMNLRLQEFNEVPWSGPGTEVDDGTSGDCQQKKLTLAVGPAATGLTQPLVLTLVRPESDSPVPLVIVVPTIKGITKVENEMASQFCSMGFATVIADVNDTTMPTDLPAWNHEDDVTRHAVLSIRTAIDYATSNPGLYDATKVGLLGSSLGGIQSAFLAEIESTRLAGVMTVVAGGNMPAISAYSDNDEVANFREARMKKAGIATVEAYEDQLRKTVTLDSMYFASLAKTSKIFMVMSNADTKVPSVNQQELFNAFGQPSSTTFSVNHVETIVALTFFYFNYVHDFFQESFGLKAPAKTKIHLTIHPDL